MMGMFQNYDFKTIKYAFVLQANEIAGKIEKTVQFRVDKECVI